MTNSNNKNKSVFVIKQSVFAALACMFFFSACATVNVPKKQKTDKDYYEAAMHFFDANNCYDATPAFEELREKFPLSPYAVLSELRLGDCHYSMDEYIEAAHYFENFRRLHPSNQNVPYSIYMSGMCRYIEMLSADRDQTAAREAIEHFQMLLELYPENPYTGKALTRMSEAQKKVAEHEFFIGDFYYKKGNYKVAVKRYRKILEKYPHSIAKDKLLFHLAEATIKSGSTDKGKKIFKLLLTKYPESSYGAEAKSLLNMVKDKVAKEK